MKLDERQIKKKSAKELLDITVGIIKDYRILFDKILGQTPNEIQEMHEILERFTSKEIRDALRTYKGRQPHASSQPIDMQTQLMNKMLEGFAPWEIVRALKQYRIKHPKR